MSVIHDLEKLLLIAAFGLCLDDFLRSELIGLHVIPNIKRVLEAFCFYVILFLGGHFGRLSSGGGSKSCSRRFFI